MFRPRCPEFFSTAVSHTHFGSVNLEFLGKEYIVDTDAFTCTVCFFLLVLEKYVRIIKTPKSCRRPEHKGKK